MRTPSCDLRETLGFLLPVVLALCSWKTPIPAIGGTHQTQSRLPQDTLTGREGTLKYFWSGIVSARLRNPKKGLRDSMLRKRHLTEHSRMLKVKRNM